MINKLNTLSVTTLTSLLLLSNLSIAAESDTSMSSEKKEQHGKGFGGFTYKFTKVGDESAIEFGGFGFGSFDEGDHAIILGGGGWGLTDEIRLDDGRKLAYGYGGLMVGYIYMPQKTHHFSTTLLLGGGGVDLVTECEFERCSNSGSFFVSEISAAYEFRATSFMEIGIGAAYRYANDPDLDGISGKDLSAPSAFISFKFGDFDY